MKSQEKMIHRELASHARRHRQSAKLLGKLTTVRNGLWIGDRFDFRKTHFEAKPGFYSESALQLLAKIVVRRSIEELAKDFDEKMDAIMRARESGRTMLITGHGDMFEPMADLRGLQVNMARNYGENLEDLAYISHIMATRTSAYSSFMGVPIIELGRNMTNIHLSFPGTSTMKSIPGDFLYQYGTTMLENFATATEDHDSLAVLAASSKNEEQQEDGTYVMPQILPAVSKRIIRNGWNLVPVAGTKVDGRLKLVVGEPIMAGDVTKQTPRDLMRQIAQAKTDMGTPTIYPHAS